MAFIRIRKIGNHHYRYLEERYREGGKVKSRSKCLGRFREIFAGALTPIPPDERGWKYIERWMERDAKKDAIAQQVQSSPQPQATVQTPSPATEQAPQEDGGQQGTSPSTGEK